SAQTRPRARRTFRGRRPGRGHLRPHLRAATAGACGRTAEYDRTGNAAGGRLLGDAGTPGPVAPRLRLDELVTRATGDLVLAGAGPPGGVPGAGAHADAHPARERLQGGPGRPLRARA